MYLQGLCIFKGKEMFFQDLFFRHKKVHPSISYKVAYHRYYVQALSLKDALTLPFGSLKNESQKINRRSKKK